MGIVYAVGYAVAVLAGADRLLLWMESRGQVNWRRTGRPPAGPRASLESLLDGPERIRAGDHPG
ncbi:hypothetical protein Sru01_60540 [Sphaerisporangium rufum]|uniref:Uncharacterized protein n=1 Tax=Sphaerisporangium rufum TaxID=1381558 RepID=A0A919V3Q2_9ACTN|nr:hypothetical protein [Sphaerisporangium rufum]GII81072.1 hypothetical protein Sru01_60540 [Sphaerisporangium rufum]